MSTAFGEPPVPGRIHAGLREFCPPVCVTCDYSLVGLPAGSPCPECGTTDDPSVITLRGWSTDSWGTTRPRQMVASAILFAVIAVFLVNGISRRQISPVQLAVWSVVLGISALQVWRRWMSGVDPMLPVRLRMGPVGFEQRVGTAALKLTPWDRRMRVDMKVRDDGQYSLRVRWGAHFVWTTKSRLINFEFDADPEFAGRLWRQVQDWVSSAP